MGSGSIGPNYVLDKTFEIATGYTITGYQAVVGVAAGTCMPASSDGSPYLGVAQLDPNEGVTLVAGDSVRVRMLGISKVQAAAAISVYSMVRVVALGLVDDANPGAAGDYWLGLALDAASQLCDIIDVDLTSKNCQYFTS